MKQLLSIILILVSGTIALAKPPKYTVYEGQRYRWNTQMKKYFPVESPQDRYMRRILKQQMQMKVQPDSNRYKVKWWDFFYSYN